MIAQLVFEGHVHRAGQVASFVGASAIGFGQLPAHIQDGQRLAGVEALRQFSCDDQYVLAGHVNDRAT
jgi:hypothetical protein